MRTSFDAKRWSAIARLTAAAIIISQAAAGIALAQAWKPERPVEIVVGTSAGGGQDTSARFVQKLIQEHRLMDVATNINNKPGGGSSLGYAYLNQHPGNAHYIMLLTVPLLTNYITGITSISHADLTPLSLLFDDYVVATVLPKSPIRNARDLMDRLRKDPSSLAIGIPSITGGGGLTILLAAKAAGIDPRKIKTVVFKSGGDSISALLGGHIDVMMSTSAAPVSQLKAGNVRLLAIASPKRLEGLLADVPTFKEQGTDVEFSNWRGIVGPRGLSQAQIAYWEATFRKLVSLEEFKQDLSRNFWDSNFKGSVEMAKYLRSEHDTLRALLADLGMAKR